MRTNIIMYVYVNLWTGYARIIALLRAVTRRGLIHGLIRLTTADMIVHVKRYHCILVTSTFKDLQMNESKKGIAFLLENRGRMFHSAYPPSCLGVGRSGFVLPTVAGACRIKSGQWLNANNIRGSDLRMRGHKGVRNHHPR